VAVDWSTVRGLLIDLDGVVYTGREPIAGAAEFLALASQRNFPFLLVTNNSTTSPQNVAGRLKGMRIEVTPEQVLTSGQAAMAYVRSQSKPGARVQVVGEAGLRQAAEEEGLVVSDDGAEWVVAGLDRSFDYQKLTNATRAILGGARFVASNADALLPVEGGAVLPGAGTMVAAIRAATAVEPIVVGKPSPGLFQHGLARLGHLAPDTTAMVGDRLDTDIEGGHLAGLRTILVLSGVTTPQQVSAAPVPPDAVVLDLRSVAGLLGWS
jgi:4-nitrophenyl phosphatase